VILGEVTGLDVQGRRVLLRSGEVAYDTLILAAGSSHSYFGKDEWAQHAPGLKSIDDATEIRRRVLLAFEEAERLRDPEHVHPLLTFVIVGAGPTGVELAGAVAEIANDSLRHEFRAINPADSRIVLVENSERVLPVYPPELSKKAEDFLRRLGVEVRTGWRVSNVAGDHVVIERQGEQQRIVTRNVVWAAGVQASPLGRALAEATGVQVDRTGRVQVERDLSVPGHPEIFVIGDMANYPHFDSRPLPALAPVAMQQGEYVAKLIASRVGVSPPPPAFRYRDYGTMATVGRMMAVADLRGWRFSGALAWFAWLFVHLMQLVQRESRILVLIQWAWHYVTRNRSARLITGRLLDEDLKPEAHQPKHRCDDAIAGRRSA
jgi:NADH:ubiquinone reductase (H+-translocating)